MGDPDSIRRQLRVPGADFRADAPPARDSTEAGRPPDLHVRPDGVESAAAQAKAAAGEQAVQVIGGASVVQQLLRAGLVRRAARRRDAGAARERPPAVRESRRGARDAREEGRAGDRAEDEPRVPRRPSLAEPLRDPVEEDRPALRARARTPPAQCPRCSKSISVRPSPRSVRTTVTSSYASSPGWSVIVKTSRSGADDLAVLALPVDLARSGPPNIVACHDAARPDVHRDRVSGISHSAPPNQSAKGSGSVHSRHTRSRGASKTRLIVIPGASAIAPSRSSRRSKPPSQNRGSPPASRRPPSAAPPPAATDEAAPCGRA